MRSTELTIESFKHLIQVDGGYTMYFKLVPLFNGHKLDIKNCVMEKEYLCNKMPPQNLLFQTCKVVFEGPDDEPFKL